MSKTQSFLALVFLSAVTVLVLLMMSYLASHRNEGVSSSIPSLIQTETVSLDGPEAVVSNHALATRAGMDILEQGGTAADAAVAVAAVLSVVEPWFSSVLGGGTWALYYDAENDEVKSLDGVGPTGSKVTVADYTERAGEPGMHQANVPGAWDGWMVWLETYGELDLNDVLAPAISLARSGYSASPEMIVWLTRQEEAVLANEDAAKIYAPDGSLITEGDVVYQYDMAQTLESLVVSYELQRPAGRSAAFAAARDYFYRGPIAEAIVAFSDEQNGYLSFNDFATFSTSFTEPLFLNYSDSIRVAQNPPNSQGITMLLALNILKNTAMATFPPLSAERIHLQSEALKLAFADRHYHVGDPARVTIPVPSLLSEAYGTSQWQKIDMNTAFIWSSEDAELQYVDEALANTTTFHVVDTHGNAAAVTTSLGAQFLVVGNTGIHINHRMRFLALEDGDPNQVSPGYKVRHTSNPYMAFKDGDLYILGGNTGADSQVQGQVQQFINVVEFGMDPQEAVGQPRFMTTAFPSTVYPHAVQNVLQLEEGINAEVVSALEAKGHTVVVGEGTWGSANMLLVDQRSKSILVGAEPRVSTALGLVR